MLRVLREAGSAGVHAADDRLRGVRRHKAAAELEAAGYRIAHEWVDRGTVWRLEQDPGEQLELALG